MSTVTLTSRADGPDTADQPVCLCGDDKLEHRQGRRGCKVCDCEQYEPVVAATDPAEGETVPRRPAGRAEVLDTYDAWLCRTCGARYVRPYTDHACGPLIPVTVTITAIRSTARRAA